MYHPITRYLDNLFINQPRMNSTSVPSTKESYKLFRHFGSRPADITGGSRRVYIHRHVPVVSAAGRGQIRGFPLRTLSTFRSRARSLCPRATAAKLRCHHCIQCDSRDAGFTSGPYPRTKPSGSRRLAAHDGGDASAALVRCHIRSHGWLVAVPRSGFADALSSSLTSTMETASARN